MQERKNIMSYAAGSNIVVHVVNSIGWADNERSAGVNDSMAATITGHSLSVDGNTVHSNRRSRDNSILFLAVLTGKE